MPGEVRSDSSEVLAGLAVSDDDFQGVPVKDLPRSAYGLTVRSAGRK